MWIAIVAVIPACGRIDFDVHDPRASTRYYQAAMESTQVSIPIDPVDPDRTLVVREFELGGSALSLMPLCDLVDATTLQVAAFVASPSTRVHAQVIEFDADARVQRGRVTLGTASLGQQIAIEPIDTGKSFAIVTRTLQNDLDASDHLASVTIELAPTQLTLSRRFSGDTLQAAWQVVELDDAVVQSGVARLGDGENETTVAIQPVDRNGAFAVAASRASGEFQGHHLVRTRLDGDALVLARNGYNSIVDIAWFVVELPDIHVQHAETAMTDRAEVIVPITRIEPAHAGVFLSLSGGNTETASSLLDSSACASTVSPTELRITRVGNTDGVASDVSGIVASSVVAW